MQQYNIPSDGIICVGIRSATLWEYLRTLHCWTICWQGLQRGPSAECLHWRSAL